MTQLSRSYKLISDSCFRLSLKKKEKKKKEKRKIGLEVQWHGIELQNDLGQFLQTYAQ